VSVAILTWNRREQVLRALESVFRQSHRPVEVVVVDSASEDGTADAVEERYPNVRVVRLHRNLGCPEGRNVALANCRGDIIFCLDDDAWLHEEALRICAERFQQCPEVAVVGCQVVAPKVASQADEREHYTVRFSGGACAIRRKALQEVGFYPSDFYRQAEETDLSLRLLDKGHRILFVPEAVVFHEPELSRSRSFLYYSCRNELYIVLRRYPWPLVPAALLWKAAVWNWAGAKTYAVHGTVLACVVALLRLPRIMMTRRPVSVRVIRLMVSAHRRTRGGSEGA
jgi:hypothetical protein